MSAIDNLRTLAATIERDEAKEGKRIAKLYDKADQGKGSYRDAEEASDQGARNSEIRLAELLTAVRLALGELSS